MAKAEMTIKIDPDFVLLLREVRDRLLASVEPKPAPPAPPAPPVKTSGSDPDAEKAMRVALSTLLAELNEQIGGQRENHNAMEHRNEDLGDECWRRYSPADIRDLARSTARRLGLKGFLVAASGPEDDPA